MMKTQKTMFRNLVKYLFTGLLVIGVQSCDTEIPPEDNTPPEFILQISGDGFFHEFNQDSDFDNIQLNLRNGARYKYIFSASDQGGVDLIQWFIPYSENMTLENPISAPWTFRNIGILSLVEWVGDRNSPTTGSAISDHFNVRGNNDTNRFEFYVKDFGGESTMPNEISTFLQLYIGNHPTEIRTF